jgi:hypothetical protein
VFQRGGHLPAGIVLSQGATVNDVVLSVVSGALRGVLHQRGETVDR